MRVAHLEPSDLDRMAIEVHRQDDPDFDFIGIDAGREDHAALALRYSFAAYAPDPDRDFQRGHDAGFQEGYLAAINEARMVRWGAPRLTRLDALIIGLALAIVTAVLLAGATG